MGPNVTWITIRLPRWVARESGLTSSMSDIVGWLPALVTTDNGLVVATDGGAEFYFYVWSGHCLCI